MSSCLYTAHDYSTIQYIVEQPKISSRISNDTHIMNSITYEEKEKALNILTTNPSIKKIFENNNWSVVEAAVLTDDNNQKIGVGIKIKFEPSVWTEGTFYDPTNAYTARLWLGSLHAAIDLTQDKIIFLNEGIGKPVDKISLNATLARAEVARNYKDVKSLGTNIDAYLLAVYDNMPNYGKDVAIFRYTNQE